MAAHDPLKERLNKERELRVAARDGDKNTVVRLLESRVNVNAYGEGFRKTALHLAAQENHPTIVEVLIAAGANPLLEDKDNNTALKLAQNHGHSTVVKILKAILPTTRQPDESAQVSKSLALQGYDPRMKSQEKIGPIITKLITLVEKQQHIIRGINEEYKTHNASSIIPSIKEKLFGKTKTFPELSSEERIQLEADFSMYKIVHDIVSPAMQQLYILMQRASNKDANNAMVFFIMQSTIVACLKYKKQFIERKKEILDSIQILVKQKDPYVNKKTKSKTKKILDNFENAFLGGMVAIIHADAFAIIGKSKGYDEFIEKYFPDVKALELLSYESIETITSAATTDSLQEYLSIQTKILDIIERYFEDCESELKAMLLEKQKQIDTFITCNSLTEGNTLTFQDFSEEMQKMARDLFTKMIYAMTYHLQTFKNDFDLKPTPQWMLHTCYLYGRRLVLVLGEELKDANNFLKGHFQHKCETLRNTFLRSITLKEPPVDWASIRAKEKQTQKAMEAKKREESQTQRTNDQLRVFSLKQQKLAEEKEKDEKTEIAKKMLKKLASNDTLSALTASILQGNTSVKISDFCKLIVLLEIPGYEAVKDPHASLSDNKLTLHHKPHFGIIVTHIQHNTDRDDSIHIATVRELKALLETFEITSDNLKSQLDTIKKLSMH